MERVRAASPPHQFYDVHIRELQADPAGVAEAIYRHFDLPIDDAARAAWRRHAVKDPRAGHGKHDFDQAEYGLDAATVRAQAPGYSARIDAIEAAMATRLRSAR
jgi:hypothetical protein